LPGFQFGKIAFSNHNEPIVNAFGDEFLTRKGWPFSVASKIKGIVVQINSDGDLITDIADEQLVGIDRSAETKIVVDDEHETFGLFEANHNQPAMTLIAIVEPKQTLRLHLVSDSASMMLGVTKGAKVEVRY